MLLHELTKSTGRKKPGKRLGRWDSSGAWNYSGRGIKWQGARSWWGVPAWFEWWQTPLHMRLPKLRGFKRYFKLLKHYELVNVGRLEQDARIDGKKPINKELLATLWYIKKVTSLVKILWNGDLKKSLQFEWIDAVSATALKKIEDAWGVVKLNT